jgi:hypothetical protein
MPSPSDKPPLAACAGLQPHTVIVWMMHIVDGEAATTVPDDHGDTATVDGLVHVEVYEQVVDGSYGHVASEHDPQGLVLGEAVVEGARRQVISVTRVRHHVAPVVLAGADVTVEANGAVGEALLIVNPSRVTAPAVVHQVVGAAVTVVQHPSVL